MIRYRFRPRVVSRVAPVVLLTFVVLAAPPFVRAAAAQDGSHWGVAVSINPSWKITDSVKKLLQDDNEELRLEGSEFTIGFVRGRTLGGDWGANFVRKMVKDGSGTTKTEQQCPSASQCYNETEVNATQGVFFQGFEVHWNPAFVTIARRVQIGLNIGGGVGSTKGNIVKTTDGFDVTGFNPQTQKAILTPKHETETDLAKDELLPIFPFIKIEVTGAAIIAPGLKAKVAVGLNMPAIAARVEVVYLIGAK